MKLKLIDEEWINEKIKQLYENKDKEKSDFAIKLLIGVKLHLQSPKEEITKAFEAGRSKTNRTDYEFDSIVDYLKQKGYEKD